MKHLKISQQVTNPVWKGVVTHQKRVLRSQ